MSHIMTPHPAPEPPSAAELKAWALSELRKPAVTAADYRLRGILNDLLTEWTADQLLAEIEVAS